jgi:hypothetical protein
MKLHIAIIATMLIASASLAGNPTFEFVQKQFQEKALSLLSEEDASVTDLQAKIAKFADETFGAHPNLMRKEAEQRFKSLPQYSTKDLIAYVEHKSWDQCPLPPLESGWVWLMFGWDPEKLADSAKKTILSSQLGPEGYGRLALLNVCCPDKVYRLGKGKFPDLVVDSLGDLFVIKVEMTDVGVCKPTSVRWMKKKESRTTESTPTK